MYFFLFPLTYSFSSHISYMGKVAPDRCSWNWPAHHIPTTVMFKHTAGFVCILSDSVIYWGRSWPFAFLHSFQEMLGQLVQQAQLVNQCFSVEAVCWLGGIVSSLGNIVSWVVSCVLLCVIFKGAHLSVMFAWLSESPRWLCNKYITFRSVMIIFKRYWKMNLSVQIKSKSKQLLTGLTCSLFVFCAAHWKREC